MNQGPAPVLPPPDETRALARLGKIARHQFGGKMLDERISSLPGLRSLAFRQVFICRKI